MMYFKIIRKIIGILVVFAIIFTIGFSYFVSPNDYTISSYQYNSTSMPNAFHNFKIAFFSDCNISSKKDVTRFEKMVNALNEESFDMAIFGGDLYDGDVIESSEVSSILKNIDCTYGKFAVLGDKDSSSVEIEKILNEGGFEVLTNTSRTIYYNNKKISLIGLDSETKASTIKKDTDLFKICVVHQPDSFDNNSDTVNLQLSGHSNGGSFYLPYIGGLITSDGCKTYNHGTYTKNKATLLVTNGVRGSASLPYKFLCRNEIKIITLSYKSGNS